MTAIEAELGQFISSLSRDQKFELIQLVFAPRSENEKERPQQLFNQGDTIIKAVCSLNQEKPS